MTDSKQSPPTTMASDHVWLISAMVLAAACWSLSWVRPELTASHDAGLTTLALSVLAAGIALRLVQHGRSTSQQQPGSPAQTYSNLCLWVLVWFAEANVLGLVVNLSPVRLGWLPALIAIAASEFQLLPLLRKAFRDLAAADSQQIRTLAPLNMGEPALEVSRSPDEDSLAHRATFEERTPTGLRVVHGWVRIEFEPGVKAQYATIGFTPAFPTLPEFEIDLESSPNELDHDSDCLAETEHITVGGARVSLRRSGSFPAESAVLHWHALENHHSETPTLLDSALP